MADREVAQAGSAPGLGPGGRRFESCLPDQLLKPAPRAGFPFWGTSSCYNMLKYNPIWFESIHLDRIFPLVVPYFFIIIAFPILPKDKNASCDDPDIHKESFRSRNYYKYLYVMFTQIVFAG